MRITGGEWASRRIAGPGRGLGLRPTPDALREQAFAILAAELAHAVFLDLFAGTGVDSLEALSRGAGSAVLVERSAAALALIRRNFSAIGVAPDRYEVVPRAVGDALSRLAARGLRAAIVWCDPPFSAWHEGPAALAQARTLGVVREGAAVVLEAPPKATPALAGFDVVRELRGAFLLRLGGASAR